MKKNFIVLMASTSLLAGSALAGTMGPIIQTQPDLAWVGTFSAGPVWSKVGKTQTVYVTPEIEKAYVANQSNQTLFNGEAFLGLQKSLTPTVQGQLGLAVGFTDPAHLTGKVWDDADPNSDNYIYRYKIQHTHIALKGKLLMDAGYWVTPWVSGSLGVGFNNAHRFHSTPTIFEALPTPDYSSHTQTAFTYTVGAGVQKALNEHWQVGVGYEFADWGKSRLGRAAQQTQNSGPGLSHLYSNGLLFNLTFTI